MTETIFGVQKVHGFAYEGESLTSNVEYITVTTNNNILMQWDPSNNGNATSQAALDKLIEIVRERGQPVLLAPPTAVNASTYVLYMMNEHFGAWGALEVAASSPTNPYNLKTPPVGNVQTNQNLAARIAADGVDYGFGSATTTVSFDSVFRPLAHFSAGTYTPGNPWPAGS